MAYSHENRAAEHHPHVSAFVLAARSLRANLVMQLEDIAAEPLLPFAQQLVVSTWDAARQDFLFRYWGSEHVETYGQDLTFRYASEGGFADHHELFTASHLQVIERGRPVYAAGILDWVERERRRWFQVILPLKERDLVTDTLSYFYFE